MPTSSPSPVSRRPARRCRSPGGYRLSGRWSFASGCDISAWGKLGAIIKPPGAGPPYEGAFFLLPVEDCQIVDNWFVCGLAGTGSKDIVVEDLFVPEHRVLPFARPGPAPRPARGTTTTRSTASRC